MHTSHIHRMWWYVIEYDVCIALYTTLVLCEFFGGNFCVDSLVCSLIKSHILAMVKF